jgi:hypothetical protein
MLLLLVLVLTLVTFGVTLDVIERGRNNIVARVGRDIADSGLGKSVLRRLGTWGETLGAADATFGATALGAVAIGTEIVGGLVILLILRQLIAAATQVIPG